MRISILLILVIFGAAPLMTAEPEVDTVKLQQYVETNPNLRLLVARWALLRALDQTFDERLPEAMAEARKRQGDKPAVAEDDKNIVTRTVNALGLLESWSPSMFAEVRRQAEALTPVDAASRLDESRLPQAESDTPVLP